MRKFITTTTVTIPGEATIRIRNRDGWQIDIRHYGNERYTLSLDLPDYDCPDIGGALHRAFDLLDFLDAGGRMIVASD